MTTPCGQLDCHNFPRTTVARLPILGLASPIPVPPSCRPGSPRIVLVAKLRFLLTKPTARHEPVRAFSLQTFLALLVAVSPRPHFCPSPGVAGSQTSITTPFSLALIRTTNAHPFLYLRSPGTLVVLRVSALLGDTTWLPDSINVFLTLPHPSKSDYPYCFDELFTKSCPPKFNTALPTSRGDICTRSVVCRSIRRTTPITPTPLTKTSTFGIASNSAFGRERLSSPCSASEVALHNTFKSFGLNAECVDVVSACRQASGAVCFPSSH